MLSCKEVTRLISESLDRELSLGQRIGLRMHLLMCKFCSRYKKQLQFIRDAIRLYSVKIEEEQFFPSLSLSKEARLRLKNSLNLQK